MPLSVHPTIPVSRRAHLNGYVHVLERIGAPVERGLEAARLPIEQTGDDTVVTVQSIFDFVHHMSGREGIDNLGVEVGLAVRGRAAQGSLLGMVASAPSLLQGMRVFSAHARSESSHMAIGLEDRGDSVSLWHRGPLGHHPAHDQMETYFVQALVGFVRAFLGPDWLPSTVGLEASRVPERLREAYPHSRFLDRQPVHFIEIPRVLLGRAPLLPRERIGPAPNTPRSLSDDLPGALTALLESYVSDRDLSLDFAAGLVGMSVRTLQRRLRARGARFKDLVGQARYRVATRLLEEPDVKVIDVAQLVGYDDASHFARAFRRVAGLGPSEFRLASRAPAA